MIRPIDESEPIRAAKAVEFGVVRVAEAVVDTHWRNLYDNKRNVAVAVAVDVVVLGAVNIVEIVMGLVGIGNSHSKIARRLELESDRKLAMHSLEFVVAVVVLAVVVVVGVLERVVGVVEAVVAGLLGEMRNPSLRIEMERN